MLKFGGAVVIGCPRYSVKRVLKMAKKFSIKHSDKTVFAHCKKPAPRCYLYRVFAPLPNVRVLGDKRFDNSFDCSIILRGTSDEVNKAMPMALDLARQTCTICQKQR